ncbi:MAG TPA: APC family permease [Egibacteraceae bacterium]|nr:APC family permease [Egibacteraceae bacterium]
MTETFNAVKRVIIGRPRASRELKHQLLPKWMALPVFSSDPMASVAYATEEMMLVLALAGAAAFSLVLPLSLGVATLLAIVVTSYRQTVRAYPHGGGAYRVSRENLGDAAGLVAASALLIDYTLTVAVSIAAGTAAITSAAPGLIPFRVVISLAFVAAVTVANLRGVKEAGVMFALPTYAFIATMFAMILVGLGECLNGCPQAPPLGRPVAPEQALSLFLVLRAFSSGSTALTGVEAISDGVQAFRYPQSRNAAATLGIMGAIAISLFLGISFLAGRVGAVAFEGMPRTVNAQIALAVFGEGAGFYLVQVVTAAILILAANTAYADFPRLSSILAGDGFLPRQFMARGDRLVFSNGVLVLASAAGLLLIAFQAEVSRLIQLYVVGVFTSFTLSQTGMVRRWFRTREGSWRRSATINGVGAAVTGVVLVVVATTKFVHGAWIVIAATPVLALAMWGIRRHYQAVGLELRAGVIQPEPERANHVVILLDRVDGTAARALSYARALAPASLTALGVPLAQPELDERWRELAPDVPLRTLPAGSGRVVIQRLRTALEDELREHPGAFTTAIVPETRSQSWLEVLRRHRLALRLKVELLGTRNLVVTNVVCTPSVPGPHSVAEPVEHHVVVLVGGVHKATMRALAYAQGLQPTTLQALSVNLQVHAGSALLEEWRDWQVQVPLELLDSPFRSLGDSVRAYVRDFAPDGRRTVVTCVLPEFVLPRWYQQPLHGQTALLIKGALLFEPGVVVTSVPYHVRGARRIAEYSQAFRRGPGGLPR